MDKRFLVIILIFVAAFLYMSFTSISEFPVVGENENITSSRIGVPIIPDVPKDAIPPLDFPDYENVESASNWLKDEDVVLGIVFNKEARAYPIKILNWHEIVNENVGGQPLVVTYCPLCNSGVVFDRRLNDVELSFGNTGALFESALVMYDRETESYWYHVAGEAIKGELFGQKLTVLPSDMMRWGEWKEKHPNTTVLSIETGFRRNYESNSYIGYDELNSKPAFAVSNIDERLPIKEQVIGIVVGDESKAYPIRLYKGETIIDRVGKSNIEVIVNERGDAAEVNIVSGFHREKAPVTNAFWFAWAISYPETKIYNK